MHDFAWKLEWLFYGAAAIVLILVVLFVLAIRKVWQLHKAQGEGRSDGL